MGMQYLSIGIQLLIVHGLGFVMHLLYVVYMVYISRLPSLTPKLLCAASFCFFFFVFLVLSFFSCFYFVIFLLRVTYMVCLLLPGCRA